MPCRPSLGSLLVGEVVEGGKRMPESPMPAGYSRPVRQVGEIRGFGDERAAGPAAARRSGRELFPLPCMPIPPDKVGGCRTVSRRRKRIQHHTENLNAVIRSLNWLAGCKESDVIPGGQMQEDVVTRLDGLVFDQKPSGVNATLTSEGALRELLRGSSPNDGHGANECLASYKAELVSVPGDTRGCPSLMDVLPPDDRRYLEEGSELMIRPLSEMPNQEEMPIPYWDPKLKFNRKEYNKLVVKLHDIGFFNYTIEPRCRVGVFFVWKSNRTKLRLITDARRSNQCFVEPPGVQLITAEGLGKFEVEVEDGLLNHDVAFDKLAFHLGLSDVKDCFHRMKVPVWLSKHFAWESVPAKVVGLQGCVLDGKLLNPLDPVFPCAGSLCQGFSWSLYFAQRVNQYKCQILPSLSHGFLVNDKSPPVVMKIGATDSTPPHFYVYVDNLGVLHQDRATVEHVMESLEKSFSEAGLEVHTTEISDGAVKALGCIIEGEKHRSRVNPDRLWKIFKGIQALLRRRKCSGRALEIIVGHCTFAALMNRCTLSCFSSIYKFIMKHYDHPAFLWDSVRQELAGFSGCLFLLVQNWRRPWNELVSSSDASEEGYGICHSWWNRAEVAAVGRVPERARFRRKAGHSARESVLQAAGFIYEGGRWEKIHETGSNLDSEWEVVDSFLEVPSCFLRREFWVPKMWGKWRHDDNILVLEGRAVLKSLKHIALTRFGHDVRQLVLCDNMSVVLSFERCRSKNFRLLSLIRRFSALCLSRNIHVSIRWIPSELNISDEPSRDFQHGESKLLIDLLDEPGPKSFSRPKGFLDGAKKGQGVDSKHCLQQPQQQQQQCSATCWDYSSSDQSELGNKKEGVGVGSGRRPEIQGRPKNGAQEIEDAGPSDASSGKAEGEQPEGILSASHFEGAASLGDGLQEGAFQERPRRPGRRYQREWQHFIRSKGREKRREAAALERAAKRHFEKVCGRKVGEDWQPVNAGNLFGHSQGSGAIQQEDGRVEGLFEGASPAVCDQPRHRLCLSEILQPEVPGGRAEPFWRLYHGKPYGPQSILQQNGGQEGASCLEVSPWMEASLSKQISFGPSSSSMVCDQLANGSTGAPAESHFQFGATQQLSAPWQSFEASEDWTCQANCWDHPELVLGDLVERDLGCVEDWRKGRQHYPRLGLHPVFEPIPESDLERQEELNGVDFQLCRVPLCLSSLLQGPQDQPSPLPGKAFRPKHRPPASAGTFQRCNAYHSRLTCTCEW